MRIDELSDFNETMKYYRELITFAKSLKPSLNDYDILNTLSKIIFFPQKDISQMGYYRIMCSNISLYISQLHEKSLDISDEALKSILFDGIESINNIQVLDRDDTLLEKKKQIRNCLAHSAYNIVFRDVEEYVHPVMSDVKGVAVSSIDIEFNNEHIRGTIPFDDIKEFANKYANSYGELTPNRNTISFVINPDYAKAKTKQELIDGQKKIRIRPKYDYSGIELSKIEYRLKKFYKFDPVTLSATMGFIRDWKDGESIKSFDMGEEEIPEDRISFLNKYIDYIGFENARDNLFSTFAISEVLSPIIEGVVSYHNLTGIIETFQKTNILNRDTSLGDYSKMNESSSEIADEITKYMFEGPMIYANNLLGLSYYCFNYVKGVNDNNHKVLFNLYDLDGMDGITARDVKKDGTHVEVPVEEIIDAEETLEKVLREPNEQLAKIQREIARTKKNIQGLENPKNKNPKKEELIAERTRQLEEMQEKEEKKKQLIEQYRTVYTASNKYVRDSSEFFRHLRNSMAHGDYDIDYKDFRNFDDITFTFRDYDEGTDSTYEFSLSAKKLEELIDAFQRKVNECSKDYIVGKTMERQLLEFALREKEITKSEIDDDEILEPQEGEVEVEDNSLEEL